MTRVIPFIFVLLWSTGFIAAKFVVPYSEPFFLLLIRCGLSVFVIGLLIYVMKRKFYVSKDSLVQIFIGTLIHGAYLGAVFFATSRGMPAGTTALIVSLQPIVTTFFATISGMEKSRSIVWIGLFMGAIAAFLIVFDQYGFELEGVSYAGLSALVFALFAFSFGMIVQKRSARQDALFAGSFWQFVGATAVFIVLTFVFENQEAVIGVQFIFAIFWLVFVLSIGTTFLLMYMISQGEMSKVSSYFFLVPPTTMIMGFILFGEKIGIFGFTGVVLAAVAIWLVNKK